MCVCVCVFHFHGGDGGAKEDSLGATGPAPTAPQQRVIGCQLVLCFDVRWSREGDARFFF